MSRPERSGARQGRLDSADPRPYSSLLKEKQPATAARTRPAFCRQASCADGASYIPSSKPISSSWRRIGSRTSRPLIEQETLDEWGTVSSPVGRGSRWTTKILFGSSAWSACPTVPEVAAETEPAAALAVGGGRGGRRASARIAASASRSALLRCGCGCLA